MNLLIKRLLLTAGLLTLFSLKVIAQGTPDTCHVYLVDQRIAEKAFDKFLASESRNQEGLEALMSTGVRTLGKFSTVHGEEELTSKSFPIPGSGLLVTASVYYTDEIMPTKHGASMTLGLAVGRKPLKDAIAAEGNAVAEIPDDLDTDIARVKQNFRIKGRSYLIGLQCDRPQKTTTDK